MDGSDRARVGLLLYVHTGGSSPILLLKDIFDRTIYSFRFDPRRPQEKGCTLQTIVYVLNIS